MARTISTSYATGITLTSTNTIDSPITITTAGIIDATGGGNGLYSGVYFQWSISNSGTVTAADVAIDLKGPVTITNDADLIGAHSGVVIHAGAAQVTNAGTITGTGTAVYSYGVVALYGGTIANTTTDALISGNFDGVLIGNGGEVGTIHNAGTILGSGTVGVGIELAGQGVVTNDELNGSGGTIRGTYIGILFHHDASITNGTSGATASPALIEGGSAGVAAHEGNATLANFGTVHGGHLGVYARNQGFVSNFGTITNDHADGYGVSLGGGTLTNAESASILGGVYAAGSGATTIDNAGLIDGPRYGVVVGPGEIGATVTNRGTISGATQAIVFHGTNDLLIAGPDAVFKGGITAGATDRLLLQSGAGQGTLSFNGFGTVTVESAAIWRLSGSTNATITNNGTLLSAAGTAMNFAGIMINAASLQAPFYVGAGGALTNTVSGIISGSAAPSVTGSSAGAVMATSATVTNAGQIINASAGASAFGIYIKDAGQVTNSGLISGGSGIGAQLNAVVTIGNTGTIESTGSSGTAIDLLSGGTVTNSGIIRALGTAGYGAVAHGGATTITNFGTIQGTVAIAFNDSGTVAGNTVVNAGVILGTSGSPSVRFGAGDDRLILLPGATFGDSGYVTAGGGNNALELASAASNGTLSGLGTQFIGFDTVTVDAGAIWSLAGANSMASGAVLTDHGTLLLNAGTLSGAGQVTLSGIGGVFASVTVTGTDAVWHGATSFVIGDAGPAAMMIQAGGSVSSSAGAVIGAQSAADGSSVTVVGTGSDWDVAGTLVVGQAASANLAIVAGGTVAAGALDVGDATGGAGIVSVIGNGSSLSLASALTVGDEASAELSILSGATVSAQNGDIGVATGATGNVDIEGTGSHLDIANDLNIGLAGVGVLTLGNNTELTVVNNLNIGTNGVLNSFGGVIDPAVVNNTGRAGGKGQISASVSIVNSGTLFAASGTETLIAPIITSTGVLEIDAGGNLAVNVGSVVATQTVTFTDGTGVLTIGTLAGFAATIGSFFNGDSIVVQGTSIAATHFDSGTHVLTLFDDTNAVAGTLQFGSSITDGSSIVVNGVTPCFVTGTRISTLRGEVRVEALAVGDAIHLADGDVSPITWLGHRRIDCSRHPEPWKVWPVRVAAHAFGPGRPARDLWLSPDHGVFIDGVLIPVKHLVNDTSIVQVAVDEVTYWHVELSRHAVLLAEGLPAESYLDTGDRGNFANGADPLVLHPDFATRRWEADGCAPIVVTGAQLEAARRWINNIAVSRVEAPERRNLRIASAIRG